MQLERRLFSWLNLIYKKYLPSNLKDIWLANQYNLSEGNLPEALLWSTTFAPTILY
jgi:hypothetical protein